jgi:hypothetical protein
MQLLLDNYKPNRPFATNDYSAGLYQHNKSTALGMKHIETAPRAYQNVMVLDFDLPDADMHIQDLIGEEKMATPNLIVINENHDRHAHAVFFFEYGASTDRTQSYLDAIRKKTTFNTGADMAYSNRTFRNPLMHPTQILTDHLYTFEEMMNMVKDVHVPSRNTDSKADVDMLALGRNARTFELLRHFAYGNWWNYRNNPAGYEIALMEKAHEINCTHEQALPLSEVKATVASVIRYVNKTFSVKKFLARQSALGIKSGEARRKLAFMKYTAVTESMAAGISMKDSCEGLGINYASYRASLKKYKEMFEN